MIWSHPFETWPEENRPGPHPLYEGPSVYRPVWHATARAMESDR